jgi:hypothetical protein
MVRKRPCRSLRKIRRRASVDHVTQQLLAFAQRRFRALESGHVGEIDDRARDRVVERAVGQHAQHQPKLAGANLALYRHQRALHISDVGQQIGARKARGQIGEWPSKVRVDEVKERPGGGRELRQLLIAVEKNGGHLGGREEIVQVGVADAQFVDLLAQLSVDGLQLHVRRQ